MLLKHRVLPYLEGLSEQVIRSHYIHIIGMGESMVEAKLYDMMAQMKNPTVAPYCKDGEVMVRVTASAAGEAEAEKMMMPVIDRITGILGDVVYSIDTDTIEETVLSLLKKSDQTVTTAESCTGGLLAKRLTDIPGSSEVFPGGLVTYSDQQKTTLLHVPSELLETYGAVSEEVAVSMAVGARNAAGTSFALSVTGLAGPDGDGSGKPVGLIYIALADETDVWCQKLQLNSDRARNRTLAASYALDLLRRRLTGLEIV